MAVQEILIAEAYSSVFSGFFVICTHLYEFFDDMRICERF